MKVGALIGHGAYSLVHEAHGPDGARAIKILRAEVLARSASAAPPSLGCSGSRSPR